MQRNDSGHARETRRAALGRAAALGGVALGAAAGCVPGQADPRRAEPAGAATINILYGGGGQPVQDLYDRIAFKRFKERFPGSTINLDSGGNPMSKVLTLHAAGSAPDLIQGADTWTIDVARQQLGIPLDDRTKTWGARNDFVKSAWDSGFDSGKQWGLPLFVTARVVYLRKAVLTEANITKTPETWEELVDTAKRSTKVEGDRIVRQGFASSANDGWWWFFWLLQTTGATLFKDGKPAFQGGEGETVLQFMIDMQKAIAPPGAEPLGGNDAANFTTGTVPHAWLHLAPFKDIEKSNPKDYREMVISTPQVPGNTLYRTAGGRKPPLTFVDNALLFISPQSKYPDHVWELTKLLLDGETLLEFNNLRGRLVPRKSLLNQGHMREEKIQQIVAVYEKHGRARFNPPNFDGVTRQINATIATAVREQKMSAREASATIARDLEQIAREASYAGTTRS
jgi:ABC-type glycerol-3-phosphate transport system substrate-binding protein